MAPAWLFLFDSDCCFCAGFARFVERRAGGKVALEPLKDSPSTFHLIAPGGRRLSGPDALPDLAALVLPAGGLWRRLLAACPAAVRARLCRWISETRWELA